MNVRIQTFKPFKERNTIIGQADTLSEGEEQIRQWMQSNIEELSRFDWGGDRDSMKRSTYLFTQSGDLVFIGTVSAL